MRRTFVCAVVAALALACVAVGEEFPAYLPKVENGRVTFVKYKVNKEDKKIEKGEPATLPAATDIKVGRSKLNKATKKYEVIDALEGGLKNALFADLGPNGVTARITTDDDNRRILAIGVIG